MRASRLLRTALLTAVLVLAPIASSGSTHVANSETQTESKPAQELYFHSEILGQDVLVLPGVFEPSTAERRVLPYMRDHPEAFKGSTVLDIGTGSGIIALYAAKLGAAKVIATDISEEALECARRNAERLGYSDVIDPRLVPPEDMSAYSVIHPEERFDVIVSNPPYFLDLDADTDTEKTDTGDLGFSIIRGLETRLTPKGEAILLYGSTLYHETIVKLARHLGYEVVNYDPKVLYGSEVAVIWNAYVRRLLEREGMEPDAVQFGEGEITTFLPTKKGRWEKGPYYPGIIVIKKAGGD